MALEQLDPHRVANGPSRKIKTTLFMLVGMNENTAWGPRRQRSATGVSTEFLSFFPCHFLSSHISVGEENECNGFTGSVTVRCRSLRGRYSTTLDAKVMWLRSSTL